MTGAVGGFLIGAAFLLLMVTGATASGGGGGIGLIRAIGGIGLLAMLLLLGGTITQAIGWFGMGNLFGGMNGQAAILDILVAAAMVLAVLLGIIGIGGPNVVMILAYVIIFGVGLGALAGGLGMLSAKAKANQGGEILQIAGISLAVGGGVWTLMMALGIAHIQVGDVATILMWISLIGLAAGHILAGVAMMGQRG